MNAYKVKRVQQLGKSAKMHCSTHGKIYGTIVESTAMTSEREGECRRLAILNGNRLKIKTRK